ncbi:hypothetical protein SERLA73DRAFT_162321 [Serpula lacrymans var. lacrymans S7.3]|uniref:Fe2OG dioxygenase domain-containing protein n=2 Tax=Serpula lacrymans var. lacrymans TaxID=341189 RepID=F8Q7A8_SERL3|nr:uncharacterized protein SERLADRAFT_452119 [Serpula lacrymans var. lacrymans S7.9]EGN95446.1 hypothetical protein SERLA73DRAFT_162321 [Serpula lacrymans var. lacrymans S7.3]EGO20976.1 hypothetical protein SERLADRAFT_452119 [Serpula lacrymans var. lacrymans S7.9]
MSPAPTTTTSSAGNIHDPTSPAYKKAKKQHIKTTRNRDKEIDLDWTPFRAAEKKYKAKFPPPDLTDVLDLGLLDEKREDEITQGGWRGKSDAVEVEEVPMGKAAIRAFVIPRIPGLVVLPSFVTAQEQKDLVRWSLRDQAGHPNDTNLDAHYLLPEEGLWNAYTKSNRNQGPDTLVQPRIIAGSSSGSDADLPGPRKLISNTPANPDNFHILTSSPKPPPAPSPAAQPSSPALLIPKLRWANIGWSYHWGSKQYDFTKGKAPVGENVRNLCKRAVSAVNWEQVFGNQEHADGWGDDDWRTWEETYEPDAGIVNFYQTKDTLMAHVDRSEVCATSPLVSISLGNAAIFLIGGLTRDTAPIPILVRSGDVIIMSGPACRRAYHGVPRILDNTLPPHLSHIADEGGDDHEDGDWVEYERYMRTTRININVRQVFPKGFDPGVHPAE